jgi:hypothetical protein
VIVVGPSSAKISIPQDFRHPLVWIEDQGLVPAPVKLNRAISQIPEGVEFLAFLSDDDLFYPQNSQEAMMMMSRNPKISLVYGECDYIDSSGQILARNTLGLLARFAFPYLPQRIAQPATVMRLEDVIRVGCFNEAYPTSFDYELFIRLSKVGKFAHSHNVIGAWRSHENSMTVSGRKISASFAGKARRENLGTPYRWVFEPVNRIITVGTVFAGSLFDAHLNKRSQRK